MKKAFLASFTLILTIGLISACSAKPLTQKEDSTQTAAPPDAQETAKQMPSEENANLWTLVQGSPPNADPTPIIYEGQVELAGWIEEKTFYGDEKSPHFHIVDKTQIPSHIETQDFLLLGEDGQILDEAIIDQLKQKSEAMPLTILVDQLKINMEGSPSLRYIKIVNRP